MNKETKAGTGFITKADADKGIITAIFSVFGNVDNGGDIVHPGAFAKTFAERGLEVPVLDQHRTDSVSRALGKPLGLREIGKDELPAELLEQFPDAVGGAEAEVQFLMSTPEGSGAFERLKEGVISQWSFAFQPLDADFSEVMVAGEPMTVRNLRTVKLFEISPVLFGMNEATMTTAAKEDDTKQELTADEKAVNLSQHVSDVRDAIDAQMNPPDGPWDWWAREVFDEYVVVSFSGGNSGTEYFQVPYMVSGEGTITFAPRGDWIQGSFEFVPVGTEKGILEIDPEDMPPLPLIPNKVDNAPPPTVNNYNLTVNTGAADKQDDDNGAGPDNEPPTSDELLVELQKEMLELDLLEVRGHGL